jgi:hypothetical protein
LAEQYQVTRIPHDVILTSTGQVAYRRMSPSSASLYQEMLVTSSRIAAETSPRSQQVVEAMSGFTQVQREEQAQSPFYGEQAALAGSVGAWPSGNQSVSQFDGTLPPATVRPSAAVAPGEFGNGSNLQRQGPSHQLAEKNFPVAEYQSRGALPEVSSPFPNRGPSANAASAGQLPPASQLPAAGQLPAPEIAPNANLAVSPTAAAQATRPQPHHSVNAFYQESEAAATGHATRKVPTTIPPDHQVQQANANVVPESAPVGLEGFCPVTLLSGQKWVKGDQGVGCIHRGVLYLFADQAALERFMTSPDQWSPMLGGFDPVIMEQENRLQPGKRRFGVFCETVPGQSAIILFENESNRERFKQDSERYLKLIRDVTAKADRR